MKTKLFTFFAVAFLFVVSASAQVLDCVDTIEGGHKRVYAEGKDLQIGKSSTDELCPQYRDPAIAALPQNFMTDGPRTIQASADGKQTFVPQQVSFAHLNWVPRLERFHYDDYEVTPGFPGSASRVVQEALTRITPQAAWEQFAVVFGEDGNVFVIDNRIKLGTHSYSSFRATEEGAVINYLVPPSSSPDVWYVVIAVKPFQIQDNFSSGITWGEFWKGLGASVGGLYLINRYTPKQGGLYGGVFSLGYGLTQLSKNTLRTVTAMSFMVSVQFRNAATGYVHTFTGQTRQLFPIVRQQYIAYWDRVSGASIGWTTWDSEIRTALQQVRVQAVGMFTRQSDERLLADVLSKSPANRTPEEEELARVVARAGEDKKKDAMKRIKRKYESRSSP